MRTPSDVESGKDPKELPFTVVTALNTIILHDFEPLMKKKQFIIPPAPTKQTKFFRSGSTDSLGSTGSLQNFATKRKDSVDESDSSGSDTSDNESDFKVPIKDKIKIEKEVRKISLKYKVTLIVLTLAGIGGGLLYLSSGEEAGEKLKVQIVDLLTELGATAANVGQYLGLIFSQLVEYGGVTVNSVLGTQVMMMFYEKIYNIANRGKAEEFLGGKGNVISMLLAIPTAIGPTTTPAYLDYISATNTVAKSIAIASALLNLIPNWFGANNAYEKVGQLLEKYGFRNFLGETWDASAASFTPKSRELLVTAKYTMAGGPLGFSSYVLYDYVERLTKRALDKKNKEEGKGLIIEDDNDSSKISAPLLSKLQVLLDNLLEATDDKSKIKKLQDIMKLFFDNKRSAKVINNICEMLKNGVKAGLSVGVIAACLALLLNVVLASFYAGKSLAPGVLGNILGTFSAILTGISVGGLASFSLKDILEGIWKGDKNVIKSLAPGAYLPLVSLLGFAGLFSGGLVALAGLEEFEKLLADYPALKGWLPKVMEGMGYTGGVVFNVPFLFMYARWALEKFFMYFCQDQTLRDLFNMQRICAQFSHKLANTQLENVKQILFKELFPLEIFSQEIRKAFPSTNEGKPEDVEFFSAVSL